jgi:hypothetical protein
MRPTPTAVDVATRVERTRIADGFIAWIAAVGKGSLCSVAHTVANGEYFPS